MMERPLYPVNIRTIIMAKLLTIGNLLLSIYGFKLTKDQLKKEKYIGNSAIYNVLPFFLTVALFSINPVELNFGNGNLTYKSSV